VNITPPSSITHVSYDYAVLGLSSLLVMMLAIATGLLNRVLTMKAAIANVARDGEARFRTLAEAIPHIVWTADPEGDVDYCNQRWYELTGLSEAQSLRAGWSTGLHPDDRSVAWRNWEEVLRSGQPFEMECRLLTAAGGFRWHLVRATPLRDSTGTIVKWFGACTDIDDQMRHQEVLEEQIKKYTTALMDANARLQSEMRDRTLTLLELNQQSERMVLDLTKRSNRSTNLVKMAELLQSCAAVADACSVVAAMAPRVFPELRGAMLLFNASQETLEVAATWADCQLEANTLEPQDCWALRTGHPHVVAAGDDTLKCRHAAMLRSSFFCVPLRAQGETIGILHFQTVGSESLSESALLIANMFAEQVVLSVANIRLREALRNQSVRDPLTGLYNRRYLEEIMERETRRAVRSEQGLGLLMLDLDDFKKFNDTFGHDAGDNVLRESASFLLKSVRTEDVVCRFGGEEFVVVLPMASLEVTRARAERIRSRLRELSVTHQGQSLGAITVSIGVAELPQHGTTAKELLESADAALYRAKREGRDRVMVANALLPAEAKLT